MSELTVLLTSAEREMLIELLQSKLKEWGVEEHRTRSLIYREQVVKREELVKDLLKKINGESLTK